MKAVAVLLWLCAWFAVSVAVAGAWTVVRTRDPALAGQAIAVAAVAVGAAIGLASVGAALW